MTKLRAALVTLVSTLLVAGVLFPAQASAASLVEVTNFGDNPGGMRMHIYVPDSHPANPAIVEVFRHVVGRGQASRRRQRPGLDRLDGDLRRTALQR